MPHLLEICLVNADRQGPNRQEALAAWYLSGTTLRSAPQNPPIASYRNGLWTTAEGHSYARLDMTSAVLIWLATAEQEGGARRGPFACLSLIRDALWAGAYDRQPVGRLNEQSHHWILFEPETTQSQLVLTSALEDLASPLLVARAVRTDNACDVSRFLRPLPLLSLN